MSDPRYAKLAKLLIEYSCELKAGENILLDLVDTPDAMAVELIRATRAVGATPVVEMRHSRVLREVQIGTDEFRRTHPGGSGIGPQRALEANTQSPRAQRESSTLS